eukprot:24881-Amphidinium_carterae.1
MSKKREKLDPTEEEKRHEAAMVASFDKLSCLMHSAGVRTTEIDPRQAGILRAVGHGHQDVMHSSGFGELRRCCRSRTHCGCNWPTVLVAMQEMQTIVASKHAEGRYEVKYSRKSHIAHGRRFVEGRGFQSLSQRVLARSCPETVRDWDIVGLDQITPCIPMH